MCGGGRAPRPAAQLPEAPTPPAQSNEATTRDRDRRRRAAASGQGAGGTILTGSGGVTEQAATQQKTLLGA